mgnify:CR=1 FL=1
MALRLQNTLLSLRPTQRIPLCAWYSPARRVQQCTGGCGPPWHRRNNQRSPRNKGLDRGRLFPRTLCSQNTSLPTGTIP